MKNLINLLKKYSFSIILLLVVLFLIVKKPMVITEENYVKIDSLTRVGDSLVIEYNVLLRENHEIKKELEELDSLKNIEHENYEEKVNIAHNSSVDDHGEWFISRIDSVVRNK